MWASAARAACEALRSPLPSDGGAGPAWHPSAVVAGAGVELGGHGQRMRPPPRGLSLRSLSGREGGCSQHVGPRAADPTDPQPWLCSAPA